MASLILLGTLGSTLYCLVLLSIAIFLILLVLVQRGRGGGLSGAFGGMGGQSAFGTKAGDTFTRITVVTATIWIVLCVVAAKYLGTGSRLAAAAGDQEATTRGINLDETPGPPPLGAETAMDPTQAVPADAGMTPADEPGDAAANDGAATN